MPSYEADKQRFADVDAQVLGISVDSIHSMLHGQNRLEAFRITFLRTFIQRAR